MSVHSFNKEYEGTHRPYHIGVLCTGGGVHSARAMEVTEALDAAGFDVRVNEPWSGYDGFMYSADSLKISAGPGRRSAIMLELRNDVLVDVRNEEGEERRVVVTDASCVGLCPCRWMLVLLLLLGNRAEWFHECCCCCCCCCSSRGYMLCIFAAIPHTQRDISDPTAVSLPPPPPSPPPPGPRRACAPPAPRLPSSPPSEKM